MYSASPARIGRAKKIRGFLSGKRKPVDSFEWSTFPILSPIVYSSSLHMNWWGNPLEHIGVEAEGDMNDETK
jgi:hypothetical protein